MPRLIVLHQDQESVVQLQAGSNTLGRQSANSVPLKDSTLSRVHCEILVEGDVATLLDKGSRNGTLLNGKKLAAPAILKPGDKISIGATQIWFGEKNVAQEQPAAPPPATRRVRSDAEATPPRPMPAAPADVPEAARDYSCWTRPGVGAGKIAAVLTVVAVLGAAGYGAKRLLQAPPVPAVDLDNLVGRNGSFDRAGGGRPDGWVLRAPLSGDRPAAQLGGDAGRGRGGGGCLVLDKVGGSDLLAEAGWQDDFSVGRGGAVEASAWTLFEGFSGTAALKIEWLKGLRGPVLAEEYSDPVGKAGAWTSLNGTFTAPPGATALRFSLAALGRSGKVYFDDVSLKHRPAGGASSGGDRRIGSARVLHTRQGILQIELRGGRRVVSNILARLENEKEGITPQSYSTEASAQADEAGVLLQGRIPSPTDLRDLLFEERIAVVEGNTVATWQFRGDALKQVDRFSLVLTLPKVDGVRGLPEGDGVTSRVTCAGEDGDFAIEYLDPARVKSRSVDGRIRLVQTWRIDGQQEDPVFGIRIREAGGSAGGPLDPLQKIEQLRKDRRFGEAAAFLRDRAPKTKEPPVREKMESELRQLEDAEKREWAELQAQAFRARLSRQAQLVSRALDSIDQFLRQWEGEGGEAKAETLKQELQKDLASTPDPASERARRILDRAKQSAQGGRRTLAQVLVQTLIARYPSSEAAKEAQALLKSLDTP
jgi:hypothetical protein